MKRKTFLLAILLAASWYSFQYFNADVAVKFLNSLNEKQLEKTRLKFGDQSRQTWHFLPGQMWARPGIQLHELTSSQKDLFHQLLQSHLSKTGYDKTVRIIDLENVLAELEKNPDFRDPEKYNIAFYGNPAKDSVWAWSFEGHHISLNFTILDDKISIAPRFFGANPAIIPEGERKGERTLANEEDLGLQLINLLTPKQRETTIFQEKAFPDIVTSNESKVDPLKPVGVKMKDLNREQQIVLLTLIDEYLSTMPFALAKKRRENLQMEEFDDICFGWAGATELGKPHYYRVQGKTFLIEFDNIQNNANHIHTVWRDFDGDFGRDLIKEHYQNSDHH